MKLDFFIEAFSIILKYSQKDIKQETDLLFLCFYTSAKD